MKQFISFRLVACCLLLLLSFNNSFAQDFKPKYLRENDKMLLQFISLATDDGWLEFRSDGESIDASSFTKRFAQSLGLKEGYQLRLVKDKTDVKETRHQHYQLYWKNVLIEGGHLILHSQKGILKTAHTRIIDDLDIAVDKPIDEILALDAALSDRKLSKDKLRDKEIPKGELVLTSVNTNKAFLKENYRFAYAFNVYGQNMLEANRVYVDAVSGNILKSKPLIKKCFDPNHHHEERSNDEAIPSISKPADKLLVGNAPMLAATFNNPFPRNNSTPTFEVEQSGSGSRLTMSTNVGQALQTRWDWNNNFGWDDADLTNPSLNWGNNVQSATLAHWTVWRSYQYFLNRFGMNGTNGQGTVARILISPTFDNGGWSNDQQFMLLGTRNGNILSTVDIVAHEYGHGVSNYLVAGWLYGNGENLALNEGFSDIFGTTIERELLPNGGGPNDSWYWQIGENAWYIRNMANPHDFQHPRTYQDQSWDGSLNDVHRNAGVLDKWFHTLITGNGPNGNITPISNYADAVSIVYWALDNYIYGDYNYPNAAQALRAAAGQLYGQCSPQQNAVIAALGAVNLPVGACAPDCNYAAVNISPSSVNCNQGITLSANCTGATANNNVWTCQNVTYSFTGPNVPYNSGTGSSINVTTPATAGNYQYSLTMSKPNSGCYTKTYNFNISVNCGGGNSCDFSSGPRYVGTWNGLIVQIRNISGKNVLVTAIPNSSTDKYYPRGDNFWGSFNLDPGAAGLQSCLNAGSTSYGGLVAPGGLTPPSGYYQGAEQDGAVFFAQNGSNPPNPCDASPRHVGTWNGLNVQIRTFPNGKHALVTAVVGSSNDKYYVRGDNFWDNFTKDGGVDQYRACLNAGNTDWWGMAFPGGIAPPSGYQQGTSSDGAVYFSTNGLRAAAPELVSEEVTLVKVHPNPVQEEVTVTFILKEAGPVQLRILDLQGRVLQLRNEKGLAGKNERTLSVGALTTGLYAMEVTFEGQRVIHKLVKQ